jgi:hypothetical protein
VIGGVAIGHEDGGYTRVMYFASAEPRRVVANAGTQNALQVLLPLPFLTET